jgi:GTPase Era involved in 16S rRNA processing
MSNALEGNERYRAFMDKLAQSGVDEYVDLPMVAVMGDTSSGKSSLLSMISTIELPSSDKLTTRCPIMLMMRRADTKSASVKIVWKDKPSSTTFAFEPKNVDESSWESLTDIIAFQLCIEFDAQLEGDYIQK